MGVKSAHETGQEKTAVMPLLEVATAVPEQATTGQEQSTYTRPGSSPCSTISQQHILAEDKGFAPKSWCYSLAPVAPALPGHVPGYTMTLKYLFPVSYGCWWELFFFFLGKITLIFLTSQILPIIFFSLSFSSRRRHI